MVIVRSEVHTLFYRGTTGKIDIEKNIFTAFKTDAYLMVV